MSGIFRENARDISRLAHSFHSPARLTQLLTRFAQTKKGAELLELADRNAIRISLSDQLPQNHNGGYRNGGVELNRKAEDDAQLSTLAHELQHLRQECRGLSPTHMREGARREAYLVRDPFTYFISVRLREADAFSFETEYIRDYTEKTGDIKPAETLMRQYPDVYNAYAQSMRETSGDKKSARREAFLTFFGKPSSIYDRETLDALEKILIEQKIKFEQEPMRMRRFLAQESPFRLTASTVRKFGDRGDEGNYFDGVTDRELLSKTFLGEISPETKERLDQITAKYQVFFANVPAEALPCQNKKDGGMRP